MKIKQQIYYCLGFLFLATALGCSPREKLTLLVPSEVKEAIEMATPANEYCFYVYNESIPNDLGELMEANLYICGHIEFEDELDLLLSTLKGHGSPLFKSVGIYTTNPNLISGHTAFSETVSVTAASGARISIPHTKEVFGKNTPHDELLDRCIEAMRQNNKAVLLMNRNVKCTVGDQIVELVFRSE